MKVLVTGARGVVGPSLCRRCEAGDLDAVGAGRAEGQGNWLRWDMAGAEPPFGEGFQCLLHAAPLWLLPRQVEALAERGLQRIVALSSTSAVTKQTSASDKERALAEALSRAEQRVLEQSDRLGIRITLLRPTMIYGYGRDANVSVIAGFIRHYGFFPVAGPAAGRRQPVHADDVAAAMVTAIDSAAAHGRVYNLAGGETLTYRDMVARIFQALGRRPRIPALPERLYRALLAGASLLGRDVSPAMAGRMNADLLFDAEEAGRDLGFAPQGFLERPDRDLGQP